MFFATTVESAGPHVGREAEIWASRDGDRFERIAAFPKDRGHPVLFQYGVVFFPDGTLPEDSLIFGGTALRGLDGLLVLGRTRD
jgi:hypothetical protein